MWHLIGEKVRGAGLGILEECPSPIGYRLWQPDRWFPKQENPAHLTGMKNNKPRTTALRK